MINKKLIALCQQSKKYVSLTVGFNLISTFCNFIIIFLITNTIDSIYYKKPLSYFTFGIILTLIAIKFISNIYAGKFSFLASTKVKVLLRNKIYNKLLKLGANYNENFQTSTIIQLAMDGVESLEIYFGKYLPQLFYSLITPVVLFIFLSFISFKTALVFIVCVPLIPLSIVLVMKIAKKILKKYWGIYSNLGNTFLENLQGLTTLKVFNIDEEKHKEMNEEAESFRKITMKVLTMQLNSISIMDLIAFGGAALGTMVCLIEFKNGQISVGGVIAVILLSSEFFIPLRLLGSFFHIAMNGVTASDKIFELLELQEPNKNINNLSVDKLQNTSINLKNVSFSYDGERNILNNVNMEIKPKSLVAIVGESGCGKSTIASLIMKQNKASKGELTYNNQNINDIPVNNIYDKAILISTNSYIFNGTILDNLYIGKRDATKEEITNALKNANLYDFVNSLRYGLDTKVGEGGSLLSGGQKQRLALARAILADREIMIFDEVTSNVDVESETFIWNSIYKLSQEKTIIVISHRLANVIDADKIYVMKKGNMIESGKHTDLYKLKGTYFEMINNQKELEDVREVV